MTPRMLRSTGLAALIAGSLLGLPATAAAQSDTAGARLEVEEQAPYGRYITDRAGHSLYMFGNDTRGGASTCTDACANAWPPYATDGETDAGQGIDEDRLGTIEREDGTTQVTYAGWPLYYFNGDKQPGDALGQGIEHLGAPWHLVSPDGTAIRQGDRSEAPDIEENPSKGENPASEGQEIHQQVEDNPGQAQDA